MRRFIKLYGRVLGLLGPERRLATVLALTNAALAVFSLADPILFGKVVDALSKDQPAMPLVVIWAGVGFLGVLANVVVALHADRLAHRRRLAAMTQYFEHVVGLPLAFHSDTHSGRLIRTMLAGADNLFWLWLSFLREHLSTIVSLLLLIPVAVSMDWRMALVLIVLAAAFSVLNAFVVQQTHERQAAVERYHSNVAARVSDVIGNVQIVQSFTRLSAEATELRQSMDDLIAAQTPVLTWWAIIAVVQRAAATLTVIAIFALGIHLHSLGQISVGEIVSFVGFATLLIGRLEHLTSFVSRLFFQTKALEEFFAVLDEPPGPVEKPDAPPLPTVKGRVVFDNVSFGYPGSGRGVKGLSFTAEPGKTVAIVGQTGSGKTTTLALVYRARDPESGRVTIDGFDLRDVQLTSLRRQISVVFQEAGLFNRSIADNIRIGRPDATDAEVEAAAKLAEAHDYIMAKPKGYQTEIAERGANLSGGERQRLSIARALVKDAPILILDEATSALDTETDGKVQRALGRLREGRTTFVIAHRLSTVRNADLILVLKDGEIAERGTFDELVAKGGIFTRLAREGGLAPDPAKAPQPA